MRTTLAALVGVALALSACSASEPEPGASPTVEETPTDVASPSAPATERSRVGGTFRYALSADPESIDPRLVADEEGAAVVDALFDSLVALDDDLQVVPAAASSWTVSEDATEFEFTLREDATFHNGEPVTAQDFIRAFNRMVDGTADPRSFVAYQLAPVVGFDDAQVDGAPLTGLEAVDERTLRIRLRHPFAEFLEVLAHPSLAPVPQAADEDPDAFATAPIGNGPFEMAGEWLEDEFIRVARFDGYAGEPALLDEVVFQIYSNDPAQEAQWAEFQAGRLHFAQVPPQRLDQAVEEYGISDDGYTGPGVLDGITTTIYYYGFNTQQPPFDDPAVRRAVSEVIDREGIVTEITNETREVADAVVPPSLPAHQSDACRFCAFDAEAAAAHLAERPEDAAPIDAPIVLLHNTGRTHEAIAERVAGAIEEILSIEVDVRSADLPNFVQALRAGEMGIFRLGWQADYPSAGSYLYPLFHSSTIGQDNLTRYADPEVDALLDEARAELDQERRTELYRDVERRVLDAAVIAPIFVYRHNRVVAPDVRDFRFGPMGQADLTQVWLDSDA